MYPEAPTSNAAVLAKTAADQLVWGPAMCCVFFAFLKLLEGHPDQALPTIQVQGAEGGEKGAGDAVRAGTGGCHTLKG